MAKTPESPEPAVSLADVMAALQALSADVQAVKARQHELETAPPPPRLYGPRELPEVTRQSPVGEQSRNIPRRADRDLEPGEERFFQRHFDDGMRVRIRRESTRDGASKSWAEILDPMGQIACPTKFARKRRCTGRVTVGEVCETCGKGPTVLSIVHLSKANAWKYRVRVPGLTHANGDGFAEYELEAV